MLPIVARKKMLASDLTTKLKMSQSDTASKCCHFSATNKTTFHNIRPFLINDKI